jgi:hypothetical protein
LLIVSWQSIIDGFNNAQRLGINVGASPGNPLTNSSIQPRSADIVYVIAPWRSGTPNEGILGESMGASAGNIAKLDAGSIIYVAGDSYTVPVFQAGVARSGYVCTWRNDSISRFAEGSSYIALTIARVCER